MSFILDALKKSRSVERGGEVALDVRPTRRVIPGWVKVAGVVLVAGNVALLAWALNLLSAPQKETATDMALDQPEVAAAETRTPPRPPPASQETAAVAAVPQRPSAPARAREPAPDEPVRIAPPPRRAPPVQTVAPPPAQPPPRTYRLAELSPAERAVFDDLTYTTHIFTEDPELCAIVINGERLQMGDEIAGLTVAEITTDGLVFRQTHDGRDRLVAVSVIEQWEK